MGNPMVLLNNASDPSPELSNEEGTHPSLYDSGPPPIERTLSFMELSLVNHVAGVRQIGAMKKKAVNKCGESILSPWLRNLYGCSAELVVSKEFNLYWNAVAERPKDLPGDTGNAEVRMCTNHQHQMLLYPHDYTDHIDQLFVFVSGLIPHLSIRGWAWASDVMIDKHTTERRGFQLWEMPSSKLEDPRELYPDTRFETGIIL
jgi:hypothetical protein